MRLILIIVIVLSLIVVPPAFSFQGIWLPSFGAGQAGVGGAFYDPNGSPLDLEENPAMITRIKGSAGQFTVALNRANIHYQDRYYDPLKNTYYSNDKNFNPVAPLPALGYAKSDGNFAYGFAVYAQGGGGGDFQSLQRTFVPAEPGLAGKYPNVYDGYNRLETGNLAKESLTVQFAVVKVTPGIAWKMGSWRIGFALDAMQARMNLDRKNEALTSSAMLPGGMHYRSDQAFAIGGKIGMGYDINRQSTVSLSYSAPNRFYLNGDLRTDSYLPEYQGNVSVSRYMQWPQRVVAGFEYKFSSYRFVADIMHTRWSQAFGNADFHLERPLIYTPLQTYSSIARMKLGWKDQVAATVGLEYSNSNWKWRGGYSYAPTPQTQSNLNPLLGTTMDHHLFCGMGYDLKSDNEQTTQLDLAFQYSPPKTMKGVPFSDWWIGHAIQSDPIRPSYFEFSKTTSVISIYLGVIHRNQNI